MNSYSRILTCGKRSGICVKRFCFFCPCLHVYRNNVASVIICIIHKDLFWCVLCSVNIDRQAFHLYSFKPFPFLVFLVHLLVKRWTSEHFPCFTTHVYISYLLIYTPFKTNRAEMICLMWLKANMEKFTSKIKQNTKSLSVRYVRDRIHVYVFFYNFSHCVNIFWNIFYSHLKINIRRKKCVVSKNYN